MILIMESTMIFIETKNRQTELWTLFHCFILPFVITKELTLTFVMFLVLTFKSKSSSNTKVDM